MPGPPTYCSRKKEPRSSQDTHTMVTYFKFLDSNPSYHPTNNSRAALAAAVDPDRSASRNSTRGVAGRRIDVYNSTQGWFLTKIKRRLGGVAPEVLFNKGPLGSIVDLGLYWGPSILESPADLSA